MLNMTELWKKTYPEAHLGFMVLGNVLNPEHSEALEYHKQVLTDELMTKFPTRRELNEETSIKAYHAYYKRFAKTYHVLPQMESVIFKGKSVPNVAGLVEAMFMAELKNGLLTAGHDFNALEPPLTLDVASGEEKYIQINGKEQTVKPGDMMISDATGVISSIIHGPDRRTRIVSTTQKAVFIVYGPSGISREKILDHLSAIHNYVKVVAPDAEIELQQIFN